MPGNNDIIIFTPQRDEAKSSDPNFDWDEFLAAVEEDFREELAAKEAKRAAWLEALAKATVAAEQAAKRR